MENYVLYEELTRGDHSIIYKGRRKETVTFVAIHCIDKLRRPEVTNMVRMTYDLNHQNIVEFYEWYETSNHLWLVVELCTGGSLAAILAQDHILPESSIIDFGIHLVEGLHFIHSCGIIFCDLCPSKILLDTSGVLKFADFSLAMVDGENLEELFIKFAESGEKWSMQNTDNSLKINISGHPTYMAPELFQGSDVSQSSDLWALGCIFYEMFAGHPLFIGESYEIIKENVLKKNFLPFSQKEFLSSSEPSYDFLNLLEMLLEKDFNKRLSWDGLISHSFWQGRLNHLVNNLLNNDSALQIESQLSPSRMIECNAPPTSECYNGPEHNDVSIKPALLIGNDCTESAHSYIAIDELRPKTAAGNNPSESNLFTLSTRPHSAAPPDDKITLPQGHVQMEFLTNEMIIISQDFDKRGSVEVYNILKYVFHDSDFTISQIIDNPKIQKVTGLSKFDAKILPVSSYSASKLCSMVENDFMKHITNIIDNVALVEKGPPSQKRIHLLNYAASIAKSSTCASALIKCDALRMLARQIHDSQNTEVRVNLARVMALISHFSDWLDDDTNVSEPLMMVIEVFRQNAKNVILKQGLLSAIGEMLYLIASQESKRNNPRSEKWTVPSMVYTTISRCCRDMDNFVLNHISAKIIENLTAVKGFHAEKFLTNEIGQSLWLLYRHSSVESLKVTALSALCRVTWQNPSVFQNVLEVASVVEVCQALGQGSAKVQQAVITMFGMLFSSLSSFSRLTHDKEFLLKVLRLLDSPSMIIRGKAFVVIHLITSRSMDMLHCACQNRLVMYLERDSRQPTSQVNNATNSQQSHSVYLNNCLLLVVSGLVQQSPIIMSEVLSYLDAVSGQKHPTASHVRQLKATLPLLAVFIHLVASQILRKQVFSQNFMKDFGSLLSHVRRIENKETIVENVSVSFKANEFVGTVMTILEGISKHPKLLIDYKNVVIELFLPNIFAMVGSHNVERRAQSLSLFSEVTSVLLSNDQYGISIVDTESDAMLKLITNHLFPMFESLLLDLEPLPTVSLSLLLLLLEHRPKLSSCVGSQGLLPVIFQIIIDHQHKPMGRSVHNILGIINCVLIQRNAPLIELLDLGLVTHIMTILSENCHTYYYSDTGDSHHSLGRQGSTYAVALIEIALQVMNSLLRNVSEIVRQVLQARKSGKGDGGVRNESADAESLLLANRPVVELIPLLTQLMIHEDFDVQDLSLKCLSLIIQLFGGENKDSFSAICIEYYDTVLKSSSAKKQKVVFRIIKRLLLTNDLHINNLRQHGQRMMETIDSIVHAASSSADMTLSSLAAQIQKVWKHQ